MTNLEALKSSFLSFSSWFCWHFSYSSQCCGQILDLNELKGEVHLLQLSVQKAWRPGCETAHRIVSALEKQRGRNSGAQLTFSSFPCCNAISSWDAAVLIQGGASLFSKAFLQISYRQTKDWAFTVTSDPAKLTWRFTTTTGFLLRVWRLPAKHLLLCVLIWKLASRKVGFEPFLACC